MYHKIRSIRPPSLYTTFNPNWGEEAFTPNSYKNLEHTPIHHFCVRICIQLQHKPSSAHQWYKQWGGCICSVQSATLANWQIGQANLPIGRLASQFANCTAQSANFPGTCLICKSCQPISLQHNKLIM